MDLDQLATGKPRTIPRPPVTGRVVKIAGGVWVTPIGGDLRHPIGPCRGGVAAVVGDVVLLIFTQERPWIAQREDA